MATGGWCGLGPLLFRKKPYGIQTMKSSSHMFSKTTTKKPKLPKVSSNKKSSKCTDNYVLMVELRKKIFILRDIIDLPPLEGSVSINELVVGTMEDLQKLYPEIISEIRYFEMKVTNVEQNLANFCTTLKSIADSWVPNQEWTEKSRNNLSSHQENTIVETVLAIIDRIINTANERFDMMEEYDNSKNSSPRTSSSFRKSTSTDSCSSNSSCCSSPETPTSVLANFRNISRKTPEKGKVSCRSPHLWSLRVQSVEKLNPIDIKHLSPHKLTNGGANGVNAAIERTSFEESTASELKECGKEEDELDILMSDLVNDDIDVDLDKPLATSVSPDTRIAEEKFSMSKSPNVVSQPPPPPPPPQPPVSVSLPPPSPTHARQPARVPPPPPPPQPVVSLPPPPPLPLPHVKPQPIGALPLPPPPPPPSSGTMKTIAVPPPPPPMMGIKGNGNAPPPPPPGGSAKSLRPKKASTKLKRSQQLGNLYRTLKGKVEGSDQNGKSGNGRKGGAGNSSGGKQGMADALAEMTKRSAYFQQIQEDVKNYAKSITEIKSSISSFQSKDMNELIKFHKNVESVLEHLTDESQVLARFEGFPIKKLESLRSAAALYAKLDAINNELHNWKIVSPMGPLLDKIERYFTKIKGEVDALDRTKDEESKKFQSHGIHFDFTILIKIKESMVDVSSSCMELALKERREFKAMEKTEKGAKSEKTNKGCAKMLWRAFQFAYRVYTFAGGHDDRADKLTRELAHEIETDPNHQ